MTAFPSNVRFLKDIAHTIAAGATPTENPLSASHRRELAAARDRAKTIRKAARVATFNGWTTAAIAAASIMFLLVDRSTLAIVMTLGLCVVAYNEFSGRKRLLNFDPAAATLLGWNQTGFMAMIVAYSLWSLFGGGGAADASAQLKEYSDLDSILGSPGEFESMYKTATLALYGSVIGLSVLFQGGNALYYFTRRRHLEDFVAETPEWVRDLQRESK